MPTATPLRFLLVPFAAATLLSAGEPLRQASEARLWLKVPAGQPPLRDVRVSVGRVTDASWEKDPAVRERHADIIFPIRWWSWNEAAVSFTPAQDGTVELTLCGPWAQDPSGTLVRQEILWDDLTATGTSLQNGGFETMTDGHPAAWQAPWAAYPARTDWPLTHAEPLTGKGLAATWHNRPLSQTLQLKGGQAVVLKFHAKAATLPGFIAPRRLGNDTPAHRACAELKRGINLGNGWEAPPGQSWGVHFTCDDIDRIAAEGFDHIRVPVAFHYYLTPGEHGLELSPALLKELEPVLRRALDKKLHVLLDWHHFDDLTQAPAAHAARFTGGWECIARHFHAWPPGLFYELLNEPHDALTTEAANPIYQTTLAAIRAIDARRIIVVSPGQWGQASQLDPLRLPDRDDRLIVTIHCYEPFYFTHQGAGWTRMQDLRGIVYPGPPPQPYQLPAALHDRGDIRSFVDGYNKLQGENNPSSARPIRETLDAARAWSVYFGRPVHLGEFGSHNPGDHASRARYLRDVRTLAEQRHIPWTMWEWKSSFGYWDPVANKAIFHSSLFE